jgi:hypothetical protein
VAVKSATKADLAYKNAARIAAEAANLVAQTAQDVAVETARTGVDEVAANMWATVAEHRAIAAEWLVECRAISDAKKCAQTVKEAQAQTANLLESSPNINEIKEAVARANIALERANKAVTQ